MSENFRESLWERVQAGEGTPDAVFREPVPLFAKLRYALTGAAAAAAALLCVTWFGPRDLEPSPHTVAALQPRGDAPNKAASPNSALVVDSPGAGARLAFEGAAPFGGGWLLSSTQRLGLNQVAREAAKQLDNRLAEAKAALRRAEGGNEAAIEQVFANAREFVVFGDLLLDMRDHGRLMFTEPGAERDLGVAVTLLAQGQAQPSMKTIRDIVKPALQRDQLLSMARKISLVPLDPHEEQEAMVRIKIDRPYLLPKLFVIVGSGERAEPWLPDATFQMDDCGWFFGVPLSEVQASEHRVRAELRPR